MSHVTTNQPNGTPTWVELDVDAAEVKAAREFYAAVFGWTYDGDVREGHAQESVPYTVCLLHGRPVAGFRSTQDVVASGLWRMYFAADDCDAVAERVVAEGGKLTQVPRDIGDQGRIARAVDPVGAAFGLWQGRALLGCMVVNEPGALVRNDLITPEAGHARDFYTAVFGYTLDANKDLPGFDFTFLRRPDGHEIGGIFGDPDALSSGWQTVFEVADTDATVARAGAAGGRCGEPEDSPYGRIAEITDPFGNTFSVIARPVEQ